MKNSLFGLILGLIVVFSSLCIASVPNSAIAINGLGSGDNVKIAKDKFGEHTDNGYKFYFANGVVVEIDGRHPDMVEELSAKGNNVPTPAGVTVGMSEKVLNDHYGKADNVERDDSGIEYKYYSVDGKMKMVFRVANGSIIKIKCELR